MMIYVDHNDDGDDDDENSIEWWWWYDDDDTLYSYCNTSGSSCPSNKRLSKKHFIGVV